MGEGLPRFYLDLFPALPPAILAYLWVRLSKPERRRRVSMVALIAWVAAMAAPPPYLPNPPPEYASEQAIWHWEELLCVQAITIWLLVAFLLHWTVLLWFARTK